MKALNVVLVIMLLAQSVPMIYASSETKWADASISYVFLNHEPNFTYPDELKPDYSKYPMNYFSNGDWVVKQNYKNAVGPLTWIYYSDQLLWYGVVSWSKLKVTECDYFDLTPAEPDPIPEPQTEPENEPEPEPIPEPENEYVVLKANFHTHSTISDGLLTPNQVVDLYKKHGYDILAITDHGATRQYEKAIVRADEVGLTLIKGSEITVHKNSDGIASEVLGLFIQSDITMDRYGDVERVINDIHSQGGLAIVSHPTKTSSFWVQYASSEIIDGWEALVPFETNASLQLRNHDLHTIASESWLDNYYNLVFAKSNTVDDIKEALQNGLVVYYENGKYYGPPELLNSHYFTE